MSRLRRRACLAACAAAATLVAGCAGTPAPRVLLALPSAAPPTASNPADAAAASRVLALRRVELPEYLVARRVRYRADAATLGEWPDAFWAERIEIAVMRELAAALRARLPGWTVCEAGCGDAAPELALQIELAPFDYLRSARRVDARALVALSTTGTAARRVEARAYRYAIEADADTPQGHAQALSRVLDALATDIAPLLAAPPRPSQ